MCNGHVTVARGRGGEGRGGSSQRSYDRWGARGRGGRVGGERRKGGQGGRGGEKERGAR